MKRLALSLAVVFAVVAVSIGSANAGPAAVQPRTFKLIEHDGPFSFVDLPPVQNGTGRTVTPGDVLVLTNPLRRPDAAETGTLHAVCTVVDARTSLDTAIFHCTGSYGLQRGTLTLSTTGPVASARTLRLAITGGTGAYAGARGTVISRRHEPGTRADTVRLVR
jgi:Allene oxide cyclase barrel like domain